MLTRFWYRNKVVWIHIHRIIDESRNWVRLRKHWLLYISAHIINCHFQAISPFYLLLAPKLEGVHNGWPQLRLGNNFFRENLRVENKNSRFSTNHQYSMEDYLRPGASMFKTKLWIPNDRKFYLIKVPVACRIQKKVESHCRVKYVNSCWTQVTNVNRAFKSLENFQIDFHSEKDRGKIKGK